MTNIVLCQIMVQAVIQNDKLRLLAPVGAFNGPDVNVPRMRIGMHPTVHKDHLRKGAANELSALGNIQASIAECLRVVALHEPLTQLHREDTIRGELWKDLRHKDLRLQVGQLLGCLLSTRCLESEVKLPMQVLLEVLDHPHEIITPCHLLNLCTHRLEDHKVRCHLLAQLRVLCLHCELGAILKHRAVHLGERRGSDWLGLDGFQ
mmetsp:Transcript_51501/g.130882  ORF Transcript_51501/g.130882 Transcript_51501/m.130882 type:complete len:206 (-) Transcript_51501:483-1100(-)